MDVNPINESVAKILLAWGIPGAFMMIEAWIIYWLFGRLTESQESRVKEGIELLGKYEAAVDKLHSSLADVLTVLREKRRGK